MSFLEGVLGCKITFHPWSQCTRHTFNVYRFDILSKLTNNLRIWWIEKVHLSLFDTSFALWETFVCVCMRWIKKSMRRNSEGSNEELDTLCALKIYPFLWGSLYSLPYPAPNNWIVPVCNSISVCCMYSSYSLLSSPSTVTILLIVKRRHGVLCSLSDTFFS